MIAGTGSLGERTDVPATRFERPLLVVVKENEVDFYPPAKRKEDSGEKEESVEKPLPKELAKWYSGTRLFKFTLADSAPELIQGTLEGLRAEYGTSPQIRFEASKGVSSERATEVLTAIAQTPGQPLEMNAFVEGSPVVKKRTFARQSCPSPSLEWRYRSVGT